MDLQSSQFSSHEEEIAYLRRQLAEKEQLLSTSSPSQREKLSREVISDYLKERTVPRREEEAVTAQSFTEQKNEFGIMAQSSPFQIPVPEIPVPEIPVSEMPLPEMPVSEMPLPEMPAPEIPVPEMPVPEMPAPEIAVPEMPAPEMPAPEIAVPQMPAPQMPAPEIPAPEIAISDMAPQLKQEMPSPSEISAFPLPDNAFGDIDLRLSPEEHDEVISELYSLMLEKGIKTTIARVETLKNPHIDDDWHRFLVQYLSGTHSIPNVKESSELYRSIDMRLFEITLPFPDDDAKQRGFKELVQLMEQFYAGMQSVGSGTHNSDRHTYTVEIALSSSSDEIIFYTAIPSASVDIFEKQVLGLFQDGKIDEVVNDYNIFHQHGVAVGAYAESSRESFLPILTYDQFENDPLSVILNVFSKLKKEGEGAALQIVIQPAGDTFIKSYGRVLDELRKGKKLKEAKSEALGGWGNAVFKIGKDIIVGGKDPEKKEEQQSHTDSDATESMALKLSSTIVRTNIRMLASAETLQRADGIIRDMQSAFHQFMNTKGNGLQFKKVSPNAAQDFFHQYSYRIFSQKQEIPLNLKELATLYHFPVRQDSTPQLKQSKAGTAPAPLEMHTEGLLLGYNNYRGRSVPIYMSPNDRVRHFYVVGQTGTGKTGTFINMIAQDIRAGKGVCYIDPHGTDIQTILSFVPPERMDDVIYFDPAYTPRPMGLNMMEYDASRPEQMTLVIDELMGIFNQLFDMQAQGGAMFQQYFKNSAFLVMADPSSGNTLLEVTRVLSDKAFRDMKLSRCTNPIVRQFWRNAEETTGEQSLANFVPYISSKFDPLISNEIMRPVIAQEKSSFNMRTVMDEGKILLVNLSKGRLGELNSNLIGLIIVGKIQMAALSRVDSYGQSLRDFYLYIDEFQNVTTPSISSILSEARKYRLSLNIAHQYLDQLSDDIRAAVMGNVGSMAIFRISPEDAEILAPRLDPTFTAKDIVKLDNRNAYMSLLVDGKPARAFNMTTADFPQGNAAQVEQLKQLSYLRFGRDRAEVESEIMQKYEMM